ncbi:MAG: PDZ domain-containing protein [Bacteroidetes bacterium]|nr:PDZ domain-containing protein [Bacteroidota bacterium]
MKYHLLILLALFTTSVVFASNEGETKVRTTSKKQGWLGVSIQDVTPKFARDHALKIKEGAYITDVVDESPADSAGLKEGDVIVDFNGKKIETSDDLTETVRGTAPGTKANAKIIRGSENKTITVNVGRNRMRSPFAISGIRTPRVMVRMFGGGIEGMDLMELNKQLAEYFEAPNGKGVLVESVRKEENAAKAGIKAGDVITKVGTETISDVEDIRDAIADLDDAEKVTIDLLRKGKKVTVSLELSDQEDGMMHWQGHAPENFDFHFEPQMERMEQMHRNLERKMKELPRKQKELEVKQRQLRGKGV